MISFERPNKRKGSVYRVLCLGAHPDDIEIGCGGTTLKLIQEHKKVDFLWVVFSGGPTRAVEAQQSADLFLSGAHGQRIVVKNDSVSREFVCQWLVRKNARLGTAVGPSEFLKTGRIAYERI